MAIPAKALLTKYLMQKARALLEDSHPYSSSLAVSLAQDAVESLLWTIALECSPKTKWKDSFENLWDSLEQTKWKGRQIELPFKPRMNELNKARVNFKHYGQLIPSATARHHVAYAEDFIRQVFSEFLEQDVELVSLADLIKREDLRTVIKAAEAALIKEDYQTCLAKCAEAEHDINSLVGKVFPPLTKPLGQALDGPVANRLDEYLQYVRNIVILSLTRARVSDFLKFRQIRPGISKSHSGKVQICLKSGKPITREDAQFCVDFVIAFALGVEEQLASTSD